MTAPSAFAPIAVTTRNGAVESVHSAAGVAVRADGSVAAFVGDPDVLTYPRSSNKPFQALAMLQAGLDVPDDLLALVCASHSGCAEHLDGVGRLLGLAGLSTADLANTPDLPLNQRAAEEILRSGGGRESRYQNCSGKHSGMLATCVAAGWATRGYLDADHPLQVHITAVLGTLLGHHVAHIGVDGCGAPAHMMTVHDLARCFAVLGRAESEQTRRVADAMRAHPELVGGPGRPVTTFIRTIPGLVAKDGAEGVFGAALEDGSAVAMKIGDGAGRAAPVVLAGLLASLGVDVEPAHDAWRVAMLGHGEPVGEIRLIGVLEGALG
jgi:L-asparaginase II